VGLLDIAKKCYLILVQAAQQSQGIQTLLEAEKEAAKVVQKARECQYYAELQGTLCHSC
jgi:Vacuolar (H+)-ATPase G subunit